MVQIPSQPEVDKDNTPLTFGKYEGQTPDEISEKDPAYLVWAFETLKHPPCSEAMYQFCKDSGEYDEEYEHELSEHYREL